MEANKRKSAQPTHFTVPLHPRSTSGRGPTTTGISSSNARPPAQQAPGSALAGEALSLVSPFDRRVYLLFMQLHFSFSLALSHSCWGEGENRGRHRRAPCPALPSTTAVSAASHRRSHQPPLTEPSPRARQGRRQPPACPAPLTTQAPLARGRLG